MTIIRWSFLALCSLLVAPAIAQSNGMDMSMDMPMSLAAGSMLPYAHFTPGDTLWFLGWVPSSAGAMVGACIGLFLLSVVERWLAACLELAEYHWTKRASILMIKTSDKISTSSIRSMWNYPFVPEFDFTRAIVFTTQKSIQVLLMLAVMTYQAAFLISIAIGSGVGEALFGRFSSSHEH